MGRQGDEDEESEEEETFVKRPARGFSSMGTGCGRFLFFFQSRFDADPRILLMYLN